ncbi:MAG: hypothetical protein DRQ51_08055 [Gammaproteobacteria bacterium]|nr:MAG: hypothetical protein DRQ51_08055 [Gammaproteobacteria bacterium]
MLLFDIGNYQIKCQDSKTKKTYVAVWYDIKPIENWLEKNFTLLDYNQVVICSVAHIIITNKVKKWVKNNNKKLIEIKSTGKFSGLINTYQNPADLGVDRWVGAIAAYKNYLSAPIIIIDCGTAITVDLIDENKFCGGAIMCGLASALSAIPIKIKINWDNDIPEKLDTTDKCLLYGLLQARAFAIDAIIDDFENKIKKSIKNIIISGYDGAIIQQHLKHTALLNKNLIFTGMKLICES